MQDYYGTGLRERDLDGGQVMQMITHLLQVWEVHRIHMNIQLPEVVSLTSALKFLCLPDCNMVDSSTSLLLSVLLDHRLSPSQRD